MQIDPESFNNAHAIPLSNEEFNVLSTFIYDRFGIRFGLDKKSFIINRLQKYLTKNKFTSFGQFIDRLKQHNNFDVMSALMDHLTVNHTFFYREPEQFEYFKKIVLPGIKIGQTETNKSLRIWCAACSSGEEAYTLMILMLEYFGISYPEWDAGLLATDISEKVLEIANRGVYAADQLLHVPDDIKRRYFKQTGSGQWTISPDVKKEIVFRRLNLMKTPFPFKAPFHVIFCRNVMIYFDAQTRAKLLLEFIRFLQPGGYLFLGCAERLEHSFAELKFVAPSIYRRT